jgi:hypothetical protein
MNRGFVIIAQNNSSVDYIKCAEILCRNIKSHMPTESVTLLTDTKISSDVFDNVVAFPFGDTCKNVEWKLANDWQVYTASPYEYTIKIEADIYLPRKIDHWWDILKHRDVVISSCIHNIKNEIVNDVFYRKVFQENKLPNVYNALTYFKKSDTANLFFQTVQNIFENWEEYKKIIKCNSTEIATTDVVYGLASLIVGIEKTTLPTFTEMSMIHMKKYVNDFASDDWDKELLIELADDFCRFNSIPQLYPVHYHLKRFSLFIERELYGGT